MEKMDAQKRGEEKEKEGIKVKGKGIRDGGISWKRNEMVKGTRKRRLRQLDSNHISCIEDGAFRALRDLEILCEGSWRSVVLPNVFT
ncbi:hypothetical protein JOQ06_023732 [Pogonophryne albipinna]|uniref:Uncharacterized protein n=1 Tax=Pogonophryne albipinna TaxID=1090488 RepID=A0AAD6BKT2_9TELE|nr:hypothetical protein JOQ06_023732 [Pogonophryne albipinna]